jgi:YVTN family beta-propeller protein
MKLSLFAHVALQRFAFFASVLCASALCAKPYSFVALHDQSAISVYDHGAASWSAPIAVGAGPVGVAFDGPQRKVFVTNHRSDSVSVVLVANRNVVGTIALPSGARPMGIAASLTQPRAYVANFGLDSVSVVNTLTQVVIASIPVGSLPTGIAMSANGDRVFVANTGDNTVSVLDTASNTVTQTIPVTLPDNPQPRPYSIAFVDGGSGRIIVGNNNGATASVYDGVTYANTATIALGAQPTALGVVAANKVYALNSASATVSVIDPFAGTVVGSPFAVPLDSVSLAVAPDASIASIVAYPDQIARINPVSNTVDAPITIPGPVRAPLTLGGFVLNPAFECALDLNASGAIDSDDLAVVARYLVGIRGSALVAGFPALNAISIENQLSTFDLDADGDSAQLATTDGILIARAARGVIGSGLIANARNTTVASPPLRNASLILQWMLDAHGTNCLP